MTILQLSGLYNLLGLGLVILVAAFIRQRYHHPVFRWWFNAYVAILLLAVCELMVTFTGRTSALDVAEFMLAPLAGWLLFSSGEALRGRQPRSSWLAGLLLLTTGPATLMLACGLPYATASLPPLLAYLATYFWLGWVLISQRRARPRSRTWLIGGPVLAFALWTALAYPVLQGTPAFALGFAVAAFLQMLVGIGMVVFLLEETATRLEVQNEQLQALDTKKSQFLSVVSHELRTPLTSIKGYLELLDDGIVGPLSPEQHRCIRQTHANAEVLRNLVESLITSLQSETFALQVDVEPVEVTAAVRLAVRTMAPMAQQRRLELVERLPESAWALADPVRFGQVLINLLGNALKFSRAEQRVTVEVLPQPERVLVSVRDEGRGIAAEAQATIFDPFVQVDSSDTRRHGGMGLGLSIAKNLVTAMGGEIGVESAPGQGSTFWFSVPAAAPVAPPQSLEDPVK